MISKLSLSFVYDSDFVKLKLLKTITISQTPFTMTNSIVILSFFKETCQPPSGTETHFLMKEQNPENTMRKQFSSSQRADEDYLLATST
jgi:hypothetical protein